MGLWDDKCKKCFYNSWECKCQELVSEPKVLVQEPKTMDEIKTQVMNDVKEQEKIFKVEIKPNSTVYTVVDKNEMKDDIILLNGKCEDKLKEIPDSSIDCITTDPPYGYSFMGKDWDKAVPSVDVWKECLRVLKPGGFAFIMSAPRQDVLARMMINLETAGFETAFTSMYWAYATGFPKGANVSKAIDKRLGVEREVIGVKYNYKDFSDPQFVKQGSMMQTHIEGGPRKDVLETKSKTELGKKMEGSFLGFQPKPAVEVIIVCMKPIEEKSMLDQAMTNGKACTWLDDCRVPFVNDNDKWSAEHMDNIKGGGYNREDNDKIEVHREGNDKGRYPANLLVSDDSLNNGVITKSDGNLRTRKREETSEVFTPETCGLNKEQTFKGYGDEGSFSRFFDLDRWDNECKFFLVPKPSKSEKNIGLEGTYQNVDKYAGKYPEAKVMIEPKAVNDGRANPPDNPFQRGQTLKHNSHPTVKPLKLFKYLVMLGSREGDRILDPYMGSGTSGMASTITNRKFIGIEMNPEYFEICKQRIEASKGLKE